MEIKPNEIRVFVRFQFWMIIYCYRLACKFSIMQFGAHFGGQSTNDFVIKSRSQRQATITELKPNKTYSLCVLAYSSLGEGPISDLNKVKRS
jgi:hypothetical protein